MNREIRIDIVSRRTGKMWNGKKNLRVVRASKSIRSRVLRPSLFTVYTNYLLGFFFFLLIFIRYHRACFRGRDKRRKPRECKCVFWVFRDVFLYIIKPPALDDFHSGRAKSHVYTWRLPRSSWGGGAPTPGRRVKRVGFPHGIWLVNANLFEVGDSALRIF